MKQPTLFEMVDAYEKELISDALYDNNYNQTKAAQELGIHRNTLIKKMKKYNLIKEGDKQ